MNRAWMGLFAALAATGCLELQTTPGTGGAGGASSASSSSSGGGGEAGSTSSAGSGGAGGMGGAGGGGPIAFKEWNAATAAQTGQPPVYDLGGWLSIECPTSDRTSQSSVSSLVTGYGPNAARPRDAGKGLGLSIESKRTNKISYSDAWGAGTSPVDDPDPGWVKSSMSSTAALGPAALSMAAVFNSDGSQQSSYVSGLPVGFASAWLKGAGTGVPFARFVVDPDADSKWDKLVDVTETGWRRYGIAGASGYCRLETRGDGDGVPVAITEPTTITAYGAQLEAGVAYPSSYIPTQNFGRTREADKLYVNAPAVVAPSGYFHVKIRFAPNYASGETTASEHDLLYIDASNRLYLRFLDGKIVLRLGGQDLESLPTTWQREQEITVEAIHSPTERRLRVTGVSPSDLADVPGEPIPLAKPFYILGNDTGPQECADLRYLGFFPPD